MGALLMSTDRESDGVLRIVLVVLAVLVLAPMLMMVLAVPTMGMMAGWGDGMFGGVSSVWGLVMMLVWLVVLFGIGYLLYRGLAGGLGTAADSDPALEELRLAYARGDISDEEFEERRDRLERND